MCWDFHFLGSFQFAKVEKVKFLMKLFLNFSSIGLVYLTENNTDE